ncbi:hypothetical protein BJ508DRAFT_313648 [Ascobolus immersus RN42]|uniref:Uncharacterized protein n=1 Tax=Ascobolus immersus RN42 TaxID=1160509 RepID=A0A3N4HJZ4_ASCIM|nr:hypothetical protein BJ508DRAFT_313648 [Ascobolus immersus RN42]
MITLAGEEAFKALEEICKSYNKSKNVNNAEIETFRQFKSDRKFNALDAACWKRGNIVWGSPLAASFKDRGEGSRYTVVHNGWLGLILAIFFSLFMYAVFTLLVKPLLKKDAERGNRGLQPALGGSGAESQVPVGQGEKHSIDPFVREV